MRLRATIANLSKYNSGSYREVTLSFPTTTEQVQSALRKICIDGHLSKEIIITGYDTDIPGLAQHLHEHADLDELNFLASRIASLTQDQLVIFSAAVQHGEYTGTMEDLINLTYNLNCFTLYPSIGNAEEYGRILIEDLEDFELPEAIKPYIDYEAYGEDAKINEGGEFTSFGYIVNNQSPFENVYEGITVPKAFQVFQYPFRAFGSRPEASA